MRKKKWTKDKIFEESRKYSSWRDFRDGNFTAYKRSLCFADEIFWLQHLSEPKNYWTRDRVFEIARKYETRSDFRLKEPIAYQIAIRDSLLEKMDWLGFLPTDSRYWTFDKAQEESRKYTSKGRKAFQKGSSVAYYAAKRNGWLDDFPWLTKPNPYTTAMHAVYKYEFPKQHAIYIGLTMNSKVRDYDHRHGKHGKKSAVQRFAEECGLSVPQMVIIADGLTIKDAQRTERQFVDSFASAGWKVLNTRPTGEGCSSIGGVAAKWTRHAVFEEARKFKYRGDFCKFSPSAYEKARSTGWINEMDWWQKRPVKVKEEKSNAYAAATALGVCRENVVQCCQGKKKIIHGWKFCYE